MTFHLHLVSDATGETIHAVTRACLVQFSGVDVKQHVWNLIRNTRQLNLVCESMAQHRGLVLYTFVDEELRQQLSAYCKEHKIPSHSLLDPVLDAMHHHFGVAATHLPGRQHVLDDAYFQRIEAMDYALAQDDGQRQQNWNAADVIILGVSRTSKTPTSLYLANKGIKAANWPLVPDLPLPDDLPDIVQKKLVVGLTKDATRLVEIRRQRLKLLNEADTSYADIDRVEAELLFARRLFSRLNIPVIDV
ncbi:MAG: kinase/pyrophosphorylase, partial [Alphaproteobacteria bacterium]|nr:kinase/pyrophosphorylase [Alphaproteobacteria bacterium]